MLTVLIDYESGNLHSAEKAFQRMAAETGAGEVIVTDRPEDVARADRLVLPGDGAFPACRAALDAKAGLFEAISQGVAAGKPFLGICVGMQMLYEGSDESPGVAGLGLLPGTVRWLPDTVKRPQMQWNVLDVVRPSPMFVGLDDPAWVYFVHSFAAEATDDVVATCDYGGPVTAAVERGSLWATQFHPEKSAHNGLRLLSRFVEAAEEARA